MIIVRIILKVSGLIIGAYAAFMLIVAIISGFLFPKQLLEKARQISNEERTKPSWSKKRCDV